jgi:hypothetical protein
MTILPVDVANIVSALLEQLKDAPALHDLGPTFERSAEPNEDPNKCPWICAYRIRVRYPPRTLGMGAGFRRQEVDLALMVQQSDGNSGEECEARLEGLVQATVGAVLSDPTLKGTVHTLAEEFDVQYPDWKVKDGEFMQTAIITFTAVTQVGIS